MTNRVLNERMKEMLAKADKLVGITEQIKSHVEGTEWNNLGDNFVRAYNANVLNGIENPNDRVTDGVTYRCFDRLTSVGLNGWSAICAFAEAGDPLCIKIRDYCSRLGRPCTPETALSSSAVAHRMITRTMTRKIYEDCINGRMSFGAEWTFENRLLHDLYHLPKDNASIHPTAQSS